MDSNLTAVIVGALIGSIPACLSAIVSSMESRAARKHELRKLDIEIYHREKINALKQYNRALSNILEDGRSYDKMIEYQTAHDTLIMMVSNNTYTVMQGAYETVLIWHQQFTHARADHPLPIDLFDQHRALLDCMRKEMDDLHRSSGLGHCSTFEICPPPSEPIEPASDQETQSPDAN